MMSMLRAMAAAVQLSPGLADVQNLTLLHAHYFAEAQGKNCANSVRIREEGVCRKAAEQFGYTYQNKVATNDRPTGCFWQASEKQAYLNTNHGYTDWGGVGALCGSGSADRSKFYKADLETGCVDQSHAIFQEPRCATVLEALGYTYGGVVSDSKRPAGCFWLNSAGSGHVNTLRSVDPSDIWGGSGAVCEGSKPPHPACQGGLWPQFSTQAELENDPWAGYFRALYGSLPPFSYPFCVGDFWQFYDSLASSFHVTMPASVGNCPTHMAREGTRYIDNNYYQPTGLSFAWHGPPYVAFPGNTWVEVSHQADPFGDEHYGMWLLYTKGSGIWFKTGRTIGFDEHAGSFANFGASGNEDMCKKAASAGYDSVQFTKHVDHVNWSCDKTVGALNMGIEIVAVKLAGTYSCGSPSGANDHFKAGWEGSKSCQCDTSKNHLNCGLFAAYAEVGVV